MKKILALSVALTFAFPAFATYVPKIPPKPKPIPTEPGHHLGAGPWIAGYLVGCPAVGLIGYGAYIANTQHRELTCREAHMVVWGCMIPFVGAYLVDAGFKAHPEWEAQCTAKH